MNILAIETSSERGSLALANECFMDCVDLDPGPAQSATALAKLKTLLAARGLGVKDIQVIAFGSGPGMFTGLRLGCGLAQGLSIGLLKPIVAVSSLEALAHQSEGDHVVAATDARMGEIYSQCFARSGDTLAPCGEPTCVPPEMLSLPDGPAAWHGVGNAFDIYRDRLPGRVLGELTQVSASVRPHAREVLEIARRRIGRGETTPLSDAVPQYVRNKVALTTRERMERGGRV
ncbi:MAG: tRNA (adenosine(37)-N6)-threonylcarbamoyltransferase complex dimerization subunit type 1 TsaB [Rhodocyclaceae bacterium]|nr:tRNA (adenosine(37)-N6)-threonylcarbamoyltransferase complex dimerization subunit type 1 TsaB [Rhodocyclaceae bacterium]